MRAGKVSEGAGVWYREAKARGDGGAEEEPGWWHA